jgi:hypothetical protein
VSPSFAPSFASASILDAPRQFSQKAFGIILAASPERAMEMLIEDQIRRTGRISPRFIREGILDRHADLFVETLDRMLLDPPASGAKVPVWVFPRHFLDAQRKHRLASFSEGSLGPLLAIYLGYLGWVGKKRPKGTLAKGRFWEGLLRIAQKATERRRQRVFGGLKDLSANDSLASGRISEALHAQILRTSERMTIQPPLRRAVVLAEDAYHEVLDGWLPFRFQVAGSLAWYCYESTQTGEPPLPGLHHLENPRAISLVDPAGNWRKPWLLVVPKNWGLWAMRHPMEVPEVRTGKPCVLIEPRQMPGHEDCWQAVKALQDPEVPSEFRPNRYGIVAVRNGKARFLETLREGDVRWKGSSCRV